MEENTPLLGSRPTPSARRTRSFSDADYRNFLITPRAPRPPCLPPPPLPAAPPPTPPPLPPRARVNVIDYGRDLCVEHAPLVSYADSPPMQAANRVIFVEHAHEREMCLLADSLNIIELRTLLTTASTFLPRVEVYDDQRIVIAVDAPLPDNRDTHSTSYDTHSTTITFRDNQPDTANARRTDTEFVPIVLMADTVRNIILCVHSANSCGAASLRFKIASVLRGNVDDVRRHGVIHLLCIAVTILVDRFYPLLEVEGDTLDEVEAMLLTETSSSIYGTQEDIVRMIARTKRSMLEVRRRLWPFRRCLARLSLVPLRGDDVSGSRFYTRALLDHVANVSISINT